MAFNKGNNAKAAQFNTDKGYDRKEVDLQVAVQRIAGWCKARVKAGRIHFASRVLKRYDGSARDSAKV